jgi:hypothetical protein
MSYIMFPAMLYISKYMWHLFYLCFKVFYLFFVKAMYLTNGGWCNSSVIPTAV